MTIRRLTCLLLAACTFLLAACSAAPVDTPVLNATGDSPITVQTPSAASIPADASAGADLYLLHQSPLLGIQFRYPAAWRLADDPSGITLTSFEPSSPPHKLEWTDKTVRMQFGLQDAPRPEEPFEAWIEAARIEVQSQHLEISAEERFLIANAPAARLTVFSGSGGIINRVLTVLNGRYLRIDIEGSYPLAAEVLASIEPLADGLKPADSQAPSSGICAEPQEDPATVILGLGPDGLPLAGRCISVSPAQRLRFINQSSARVHLQLGRNDFDLESGEEAMTGEPAGDYLAPGVHFLDTGPQLWVREMRAQQPVPTAPDSAGAPLAPAGHYVNSELGYELDLPQGWQVRAYDTENSLNREILISPDPSTTYLSISLDFRTLDEIMMLYAGSVPEAARTDVVLAGVPGIQYAYPYRVEYYVPYGAQVFAILSDRPEDAGVQSILRSLRFMQPQPEIAVTMEDNGGVLRLSAGQSFRLKLDPALVWSVSVSDPAVVDGAADIYRARAQGAAVLGATGNPACLSLTPPCLAPSMSFQLRIVVE